MKFDNRKLINTYSIFLKTLDCNRLLSIVYLLYYGLQKSIYWFILNMRRHVIQ